MSVTNDNTVKKAPRTRRPSTAFEQYKRDTEAASRAVRARLDATETKVKVIRHNLDKTDYVVRKLGERVSQDHDLLVSEVLPQLERVKELTENGLSLKMALVSKGFQEDEIREMLRLQQEQGLSDGDVLLSTIGRITSLEGQMSAVIEHVSAMDATVNSHDEILGPDGQNIVTRDEVTTVVQETVREQNSFPAVGLLVAVALGFIVGLVWFWFDPLPYNGRHLLMQSWLIGIATGLATMAFAFVLARSESATSTSKTSRFQQWQANRRTAKEQKSEENTWILPDDHEHPAEREDSETPKEANAQ